jgi:hypothetical protein
MCSLRGPSVPPYAHFSASEVKYTNKEEIQRDPSEDHPCRLTRTSVQVRKVHKQGADPVCSLRGPSMPPNAHFSAGEGKYATKEEIQRAPSKAHPCHLT